VSRFGAGMAQGHECAVGKVLRFGGFGEVAQGSERVVGGFGEGVAAVDVEVCVDQR